MTGRVFAATEAISIEEAIRSYTITGAYINFQEDLKGSLESGKFADMIVVSDDILSIDPDKIMSIQVDQTYVGGELVFSRNDKD